MTPIVVHGVQSGQDDNHIARILSLIFDTAGRISPEIDLQKVTELPNRLPIIVLSGGRTNA